MADDPIFDRASAYIEADPDGSERVVYRASSLGYCTAALARARLGITPSPPPDWMADRYQEGHDWEREVLAAGLGVDWLEVTAEGELARLGMVVSGVNGEVQVERDLALNSSASRVVRVHPDAIVRRGVDRARGELAPLHVCEVKFLAADGALAMTQRVDVDGMAGLGQGYAYQASVQMLAFDMPMYYVVGAKERDSDGVVTGIAWTATYEFQEPAYSLADVKMRVASVEGAVARGEMPNCPVPFDYPCPMWREHPEPEAKPQLTDGVLVHLVESYARAKSKEAAHKGEGDEIKRDIDARLTEVGVDGGLCGGWEIARVGPRKGNVGWSKWAKEVRRRYPEVDVDVEQYRGAEVGASVRMTEVKG